MKIIDKNKDYYDYLQYINPDDTFTFDRTDSYELTKERLCKFIWVQTRGFRRVKLSEHIPYKFLVMQIGSTFWLFLLGITKIKDREWAEDYTIELLKSWKNYDKPRELIKLYFVRLNWYYDIDSFYGLYHEDYKREDVIKNVDTIVQAIDNNDVVAIKTVDKCRYISSGGEIEERHIPLLKSSGIATVVSPEEIYNAFDEYFSLEKTAAESTVAEGTTNNDKIKNHGFDTKTSFRGK